MPSSPVVGSGFCLSSDGVHTLALPDGTCCQRSICWPKYIGGLVKSVLVLLTIFGGLTKIYSSALLGGATSVSWLSWPGAGLFGWLGGFWLSDPLLLVLLDGVGVGACFLVSLIFLMARQLSSYIASSEGFLMVPRATRCSSSTPHNLYLC